MESFLSQWEQACPKHLWILFQKAYHYQCFANWATGERWHWQEFNGPETVFVFESFPSSSVRCQVWENHLGRMDLIFQVILL